MEKNCRIIILLVAILFTSLMARAEVTNLLIEFALQQLDKEYSYGAEGPNYFDCSGFAYYCVREVYGIKLERVSYDQADDERFEKIEGIENLQTGDLLYFYRSGRDHTQIKHVGIYINNNEFIHCSSGKGKVVISTLEENNSYFKRFGWARRIKEVNECEPNY